MQHQLRDPGLLQEVLQPDRPLRERTDVLHGRAPSAKEGGIGNIVAAIHRGAGTEKLDIGTKAAVMAEILSVAEHARPFLPGKVVDATRNRAREGTEDEGAVVEPAVSRDGKNAGTVKKTGAANRGDEGEGVEAAGNASEGEGDKAAKVQPGDKSDLIAIKSRARSDVVVASGGISLKWLPLPDSRPWDSIEADERESHANRDAVTVLLDDDGLKVVSPARVEEAGGDNTRGPKGTKRAHAGNSKEVLRGSVGDSAEGVAAVGAELDNLVGVEGRPDRRAITQEVIGSHDPPGILLQVDVAAVSVELEQEAGEADGEAHASEAGDGAKVGGEEWSSSRTAMSARDHLDAAREASKSKEDPKAMVVGGLMVTTINGIHGKANNDVDVNIADADGGGGLSDAGNTKSVHAIAPAIPHLEAGEHSGLAATLMGVRKSGLVDRDGAA